MIINCITLYDNFKSFYIAPHLKNYYQQDTIENKWLGFNKVLLFGKPVEDDRIASLAKKMGGLTR